MQAGTDSPPREAVEELVKSAQEGDADGMAGLYELYYDKIFRYISFKIGNPTEAEDLTEDVFLKMLQSIHKFKWQGPPFSSWLFRIAHNLIVDQYRRKGRRPVTPLDEARGVVGASEQDIDRDLDTKISIAGVYEAMEDLTKLQREVMSLRFAAGLSVRETALAIGKKENAVKALQHAAIKKLRTLLSVGVEASGAASIPQWSP